MGKKRVLFLCVISIAMLLFNASSCEQDISVNPAAPPPAPRRTLYIASEPSGATIFLNGKNMGQKTPDSLTWIQKDSNVIALRLPYFRDSLFVSTVMAEERVDTFVDFTKNPKMLGGFYIISRPESATVYINDSIMPEKTPTYIRGYIPGVYNLLLKKAGCRDTRLTSIATSDKLTHISAWIDDTTTWITYLPENCGVTETYFNTVFVDNKDVVWLGGLGSGLTRFDGVNWRNFTDENSGLPGTIVNCIEQDNNGNLWIGTNNGLAKFNGSTFTVYNTGNSLLRDNWITALKRASGDSIWVGTYKGLACFDGSTIIPDTSAYLGHYKTHSFSRGIKDPLYVATAVGTYELKGGKWKAAAYGIGCEKLYVLTTGHFWFSLYFEPGLYYSLFSIVNPYPFDPERKQYVPIQWVGDEVHDILVRSDNEKWISTTYGIARFDDINLVVRYTAASKLVRSNNIREIREDSRKNLWIATWGGGVTKYKGFAR